MTTTNGAAKATTRPTMQIEGTATRITQSQNCLLFSISFKKKEEREVDLSATRAATRGLGLRTHVKHKIDINKKKKRKKDKQWSAD